MFGGFKMDPQPGAILGWSWEAFWGGLGDVLGFSWGVLGCVLGGSCVLGVSWGVLGATWAFWAVSRGLGAHGGVLGAAFGNSLGSNFLGMGLGVGKRDGLRCFTAARPTLLNTVTHIVPRRPPEASKGDCLLCPLVPARISF